LIHTKSSLKIIPKELLNIEFFQSHIETFVYCNEVFLDPFRYLQIESERNLERCIATLSVKAPITGLALLASHTIKAISKISLIIFAPLLVIAVAPIFICIGELCGGNRQKLASDCHKIFFFTLIASPIIATFSIVRLVTFELPVNLLRTIPITGVFLAHLYFIAGLGLSKQIGLSRISSINDL